MNINNKKGGFKMTKKEVIINWLEGKEGKSRSLWTNGYDLDYGNILLGTTFEWDNNRKHITKEDATRYLHNRYRREKTIEYLALVKEVVREYYNK